jgi:hypothetical protein
MNKKDTELVNPLIKYIAGLFDALGTVKIETPRNAEKPSLYIWITSGHWELMEVLQKFGAYVGRKTNGRWRAKWRDYRAYRILKSILPHLIIRKDQARVGVEFLENRKQDPTGEDDVIYRLRLKLLKRADEYESEKL